MWSLAFCWRWQLRQRICWRPPSPQGQVPVPGRIVGHLHSLQKVKGWRGLLNLPALNQPSWEAGLRGPLKEQGGGGTERVVPLKRFWKRLHKTNCFFSWDLKLEEQSGRGRCELVCDSIPTFLLLPLSQELFLSPPRALSVGARALRYVKRSQAFAAIVTCSMMFLIAG